MPQKDAPRSAHLIAVSGWEDRYVEGVSRTIRGGGIKHIHIFDYDLYENYTSHNTEQVLAVAREAGCEASRHRLFYDSPGESWMIIHDAIERGDFWGQDVILDISTMPREMVWSALFFLDASGARSWFTYHLPERYSQEPLSRDPGTPRLVFKRSGVFDLNRKTALIVATGFDPERSTQLVRTFEPDITILAVQEGDQYDNVGRNAEAHKSKKISTEILPIDSYNVSQCTDRIGGRVNDLRGDYNIIMASLGPKIAAIALHLIQKRHPEVALAYVPSRHFDPEYSSGLGTTITGLV